MVVVDGGSTQVHGSVGSSPVQIWFPGQVPMQAGTNPPHGIVMNVVVVVEVVVVEVVGTGTVVVVIVVVETVVVDGAGQGLGTHEPGPKSVPPASVHALALTI